MAGLLDSDEALQEYFRRLYSLPVGDERQVSLDQLREQRALSALREEMLTGSRPAQMPNALAELSAASTVPAQGGGPRLGGIPPAGDLYSRMAGTQFSSNIEDRRPDFSWRDLSRMLSPYWGSESLDVDGLLRRRF